MFSVYRGQVTLFEGPENYRPAEDSIWLARLLPATENGAEICDAGCGSGAVGLVYLASQSTTPVLYGFDVNRRMIKAANKSAEASGIEALYKVGDIKNPPFKDKKFSLTFANPPFYKHAREMPPHSTADQTVKFSPIPLEDWLEGLVDLTDDGGSIALIVHSKDADSLTEAGLNLGAPCVKIYELTTGPKKDAKRAVLIFEKGAKMQKPTKETIKTYDPETRARFL